MHIVTVVDARYPTIGGAQVTHQAFLRGLAADFGHQCTCLERSEIRRPMESGRVRLDFFRDREELRKKVELSRPDLLIGAHHGASHALRIARKAGIPMIAYLDGFECCPPTPQEVARWSLEPEYPRLSTTERDFILRHAGLVVVGSKYLRARLQRRTGVDAQVVYPVVERTQMLQPDEPRAPEASAIVGICGFPHKGAELFLHLARRFPDEAFLLVGALHHRVSLEVQNLANVRCLPFAPPRQFLAEAKIVLVPSQWPEPFGRVALEAIKSGVPTLASYTAGLREIVGDTTLAVRRFRETDDWEQALRELLTSTTAVRDNLNDGRERAGTFKREVSIRALDAAIKRVVRASSPHSSAITVMAVCPGKDGNDAVKLLRQAGREYSDTGNGLIRVERRRSAAEFHPRPVDVFVLAADMADAELSYLPDEGKLVVWVRTALAENAFASPAMGACDQLWLDNHSLARAAVDAGVPPEKVRVIPPVDAATLTRVSAALARVLQHTTPVRLLELRRMKERDQGMLKSAKTLRHQYSDASPPVRN